MGYQYITNRDSPNYTPKAQTRQVWGKDRNITAIAIHWWGDPNQNPSFEGIVNWLCNPASGVSAHFVATGTDRKVACIVSPEDNSWATASANPTTISIECDPRCRPEDYDVVAELIADIRSAYGDIPLVPHKQFVNTQCPGNYNLAELDRIARTKWSHATEWGAGGNIVNNASEDQIKALYLEILERPADQDGINHYKSFQYDFVRNDLLNSQERKDLIARKEAEANQPKPPVTPEIPTKPIDPVTPVDPVVPNPENPQVKPETLWQFLLRILKAFLSNWVAK